MRTPSAGRAGASPLGLDFPQSLAVYDEYAAAQKAVDFLSDNKFPVEQCMIVGTDLKRIERITGRLSYGRVAAGGALSGLWLGLFVGLESFDTGLLRRYKKTQNLSKRYDVIDDIAFAESQGVSITYGYLFGAIFGVVWALVGYAATRGQRDFSSVTAVVATKYEVLVEHKSAAQARELLAKLPVGLPDPFA